MFDFWGIRTFGTADGGGLLPDIHGLGAEHVVTTPEDGTTRHVLPIAGWAVAPPDDPGFAFREQPGWVLVTDARIVFCIPSYASHTNWGIGWAGAVGTNLSRSRAAGRQAGTVLAGQFRWEQIQAVESATGQGTVWRPLPDEIVLTGTEAVNAPHAPRSVRTTWAWRNRSFSSHDAAAWLAGLTAAHRRRVRPDLPTTDAAALDRLAAGAGPRASGGVDRLTFPLPGALPATWPPRSLG